jgi:small-conductance mechanosensitive channel
MQFEHMLAKLPILDTRVAGQSLLAWIAFVGIWAMIFTVLRVPKHIVARRVTALATRTGRETWNLVGELVRRINPLFLLTIGFWAGSAALTLTPHTRSDISIALLIAFIFQLALWMDETASYTIAKLITAQMGSDVSVTSTIDALKFFARLVIWTLAILLALSNLQVNITTLIAGLGVGGVAIALAVNQILGDFFASMAILLDKPFDVGHFIMFDTFSGTVEHMGFKTTRIRSVTGEELVVGNASLIQSRIRNFRRLRERRVLFVLSVKEDASPEKLEKIPSLLKEVIEHVPKTHFERAHLKEYTGAAINYEVVYWVRDHELDTYMDAHQRVSLDLLKRLREMEIPLTAITQPPI